MLPDLSLSSYRHCCACHLHFTQQQRHLRISAIAFENYRQRLFNARCNFREKPINRLRGFVQVIVEQVLPAAIRRADPLAARDMNAANSFERNLCQKLQWIKSKVGGVRMDVMKIEQQPAFTVSNDP